MFIHWLLRILPNAFASSYTYLYNSLEFSVTDVSGSGHHARELPLIDSVIMLYTVITTHYNAFILSS